MIKNNEYTIINQKIKKETKIALLSKSEAKRS